MLIYGPDKTYKNVTIKPYNNCTHNDIVCLTHTRIEIWCTLFISLFQRKYVYMQQLFCGKGRKQQ